MTKDQAQKILTENVKDYLKDEWKNLRNAPNALVNTTRNIISGENKNNLPGFNNDLHTLRAPDAINLLIRNKEYNDSYNGAMNSAAKVGIAAAGTVGSILAAKAINKMRKTKNIKNQIKVLKLEIDKLENMKLKLTDPVIIANYNNRIESLNSKLIELTDKL